VLDPALVFPVAVPVVVPLLPVCAATHAAHANSSTAVMTALRIIRLLQFFCRVMDVARPRMSF
jgi:hypothetical protein